MTRLIFHRGPFFWVGARDYYLGAYPAPGLAALASFAAFLAGPGLLVAPPSSFPSPESLGAALLAPVRSFGSTPPPRPLPPAQAPAQPRQQRRDTLCPRYLGTAPLGGTEPTSRHTLGVPAL